MAIRLVFKTAVETPDGSLKRFNTKTPYKTGTVILNLNGRSHIQGWTEQGGTVIDLDEAPQIGDVVSFWYTQL